MTFRGEGYLYFDASSTPTALVLATETYQRYFWLGLTVFHVCKLDQRGDPDRDGDDLAKRPCG